VTRIAPRRPGVRVPWKTTLRLKLTTKGKAILKTVKHGHKLVLTAKVTFAPKGSKRTTSRTKAIRLER
jgi:hypothetical protein